MGDPKQEIGKEVIPFIGKMLAWGAYILIGLVTKIAFDMRTGTLTQKQIVVKSVFSIFAGFMAAVVCEVLGYEQWQKVVVPVSTLLGESIVAYFMSNWQSILARWVPWVKKKETKN